ncbi:hypothetical protein CW304_21730 [Bacillus sp. UFRGS-B20]|nr:hypothetical protein CW304_21730 [Bacillus sp. UFRGS-B20]
MNIKASLFFPNLHTWDSGTTIIFPKCFVHSFNRLISYLVQISHQNPVKSDKLSPKNTKQYQCSVELFSPALPFLFIFSL